MIARLGAALLCAVLVVAAAPKPSAPHKKTSKPVLPIAIVIDGNPLSVDPPPRFYQNHLLVPVRRIISALGLQFIKEGRVVRTSAGAKTIELTIGSDHALVDGQDVPLDTAPVEIKNVLYAPLRFFTDALGAQASFDRQTNSVIITSTLVGRSSTGTIASGGNIEQFGTVTAVDLDSAPPTITLTQGASVRTITIPAGADIVVQDVDTGTSNPGELSDVHPGDYAHAYLDRGGHVKRLVDAFGSRTGKVAAAASGQIVLDDGHVITPTRETAISLNGAPSSLDRIAVGDTVMVRYNIDSSAPLAILATRKATGTPPAGGPVAIAGIDVYPSTPLRAGENVSVTLHGTPGGLASYDIGPYILNQTLTETSPGLYSATYTVRPGVNFADAPVFGHLNVHGTDAPRGESVATVSVSTQPPGISDFAPDDGDTVNSSRPAIYATFVAGTVAVNPSSERIEVNGHDVTSSAVRTPRFIQYTPGVDYPSGAMHVTVRVADLAGNQTAKSWTFSIRR